MILGILYTRMSISSRNYMAILFMLIYYTFRSESPSQVFFILVQWLLTMVNPLNPHNTPKITLAYDNICNLDRLRVARAPLPLPKPLDTIWMDVEKIIDVFHFPNHVSSDCKRKYNPEQFKTDNPDFNTQAGEQTFVWVGRFKNILCAMNKTHHLFFFTPDGETKKLIYSEVLSKRKETCSSKERCQV